jgi:acyl carrier protein
VPAQLLHLGRIAIRWRWRKGPVAGAAFPSGVRLGIMFAPIARRPMTDQPVPEPHDVLAEIRAFVANWFRDGKEDGLELDTPLVTSGIVDSAGVIEVVEFLEERFRVTVQDSDVSLANCNTLQGLTELVQRRMSA